MRQAMVLVLSFVAIPLFAATDTWTGGVSALWSVAGNWSAGVPSAGDDLVFPASGAFQNNNNDLAADTPFNSITISGGAYTLNGNSIQLGAGGLSMTGGTFYEEIYLGVTLTATQSWNMEAGNYNLIINGPTNLNGMALTLNYINSFNDAWPGAISGGGSITVSNTVHSGGPSFEGANTTTAPLVSNTLTEIGIAYPGTITMNGTINAELILQNGATAGAVTINGGSFLSGPTPGGTATIPSLAITAGAPSTVYVEGVSGAAPGQFSQAVVNGNVTLSGTSLLLVDSASVPSGTVLTIIKNNGGNPVGGTFAGIPEGGGVISGPPANQVYSVSYIGGTGHDVTLTAYGSVLSTATALSSSVNPSNVAQSVTLTATVTSGSGTPTGSVQFFATGLGFLGAVPVDGTGNAAFTTSTLPAGVDQITAHFIGNGAFYNANSSSAPLSQVVNGLPTSTALTSSANPSAVGQTVTFTAAVTSSSGTPTGSVDFMDGANFLGTVTLDPTGHAALTISSLASGSHNITAVYSGDATFAPSTSAVLVQSVIVAAPALDGRALLLLAAALAAAGALLLRS